VRVDNIGQPTPVTARVILGLALPALGALIAEPLFLLADSAIVGHLGATPLAGLGAAGAALNTLVNASGNLITTYSLAGHSTGIERSTYRPRSQP
jgi:Na+-driven multidrug efflux pump